MAACEFQDPSRHFSPSPGVSVLSTAWVEAITNNVGKPHPPLSRETPFCSACARTPLHPLGAIPCRSVHTILDARWAFFPLYHIGSSAMRGYISQGVVWRVVEDIRRYRLCGVIAADTWRQYRGYHRGSRCDSTIRPSLHSAYGNSPLPLWIDLNLIPLQH